MHRVQWKIFCDNTGAIALAKESRLHKRTKRSPIDLKVYGDNFWTRRSPWSTRDGPEESRGTHEGEGTPSTLVEPSCPSRTASYFSIFLNIPKRRKNAIRTLLTVPHTYSFSESETFRKVSIMYSSGVTVSITLVSTFMGLPEILCLIL